MVRLFQHNGVPVGTHAVGDRAMDWIVGTYASAREALKGSFGLHPFGMAEAVDIHTALRTYTAWSSRQMFLEHKIGSLEFGKKADLAIWDRDLYAVPSEQTKELRCLMTLIDGEMVYNAPDFPLKVQDGQTISDRSGRGLASHAELSSE